MISRRTLLGGLAAGAAAGAGAGLLLGNTAGAAPAGGAAAAGLPLHIVNRTGRYANNAVWIYIVGNTGGQQVRVTASGETKPVALSDNRPDGFTDYGIPLAANGTTTLRVPRMSGRIYVALGSKLKFKAVPDGNGRPALAYPAGWVSGDPNYPIVHDCAEFTYDQAGMHCNTTMVDMFSVPMAIRLVGARDQTAGTLKSGARARIFSEVGRAPGFGKLVVGDKRVIAPSHGLDAGLFDRNYFAPYIDRSWNAYTAKDLRVTTNRGTFTGRVSGNQFTFRGPGQFSIAKPSTRDVLFCHGALQAPNDGLRGPVAAVLGAALNRATLADHAAQPTTDPATFYKGQLANHYARVLHAESADGKAYGFAFDDVGNFAPYIEDGAPREMTLTLTPF
ncbi:beta-1,3-glucanase family protein [Streptomyces sp. NPDC018019]|uniref:beta-1,3-glucanase family protein n=1 Tax=Streptomyces sp. NPDC018019 TaxID=3365030 RepID=UPI0037AC4A42